MYTDWHGAFETFNHYLSDSGVQQQYTNYRFTWIVGKGDGRACCFHSFYYSLPLNAENYNETFMTTDVNAFLTALTRPNFMPINCHIAPKQPVLYGLAKHLSAKAGSIDIPYINVK